jgi:hypothetical protein
MAGRSNTKTKEERERHAHTAQPGANGELPGGADVGQLVFEITAMLAREENFFIQRNPKSRKLSEAASKNEFPRSRKSRTKAPGISQQGEGRANYIITAHRWISRRRGLC